MERSIRIVYDRIMCECDQSGQTYDSKVCHCVA